MGHIRGKHAVVLGASMAGLVSAAVLGESFERVTLVERDALAAGPAHRRGVPQSRHVHGLLARGGQILDDLLPGLTKEVAAAGAPVGDLLGQVRWLFSGYRLRRADIGQPLLLASRPLLESHVRGRVRALAPVRFLDGYDISGLATTADKRRVTGVRVLGGGGEEELIDADLVLDASGRGSRTPVWLEQLGYARPPIESVHIGVGYASRSYRLPEAVLGRDLAVLHGWTPQYPRAAALAAQEDGVYKVTLAGLLGDTPPTKPEEFEAFAASLQFPDVRDALREGEPLDDPVGFQYPANVRHRYERMRDFPEGLLVLGDAVCSFNPIYGQGMTSAALQAEALRRLMGEDRPLDWRRYFKAASAVVDAPWSIATGSDLAFPGVTGRRTAKVRLTNMYVPWLHEAATRDAGLSEAFVRVTGLLDRPEALLLPGRAMRVMTRKRSRNAA